MASFTSMYAPNNFGTIFYIPVHQFLPTGFDNFGDV